MTSRASRPPRAGTTNNRTIGLGVATALVIGNMIGSGVFLLPASLAAFGGISIVGWLFTAVGAFLLALVFARLGRAYPETGGPYAYSRRAFGDFVGFQTAWGYWLAAWIGNAAIAIAGVSYLGYFWGPAAGTSTGDHVLQALIAGAAIWLLTFINMRGVRAGGFVQAATTVLKLVPLVAIAFVGIFWMDSSNFGGFNTSGDSFAGAVTGVAALTLWAFIGLESATIPAEHVRDPERNIPRATLFGTIGTAVVYVLGTVAVMGIIPADTLGSSAAPFADAAKQIWGGWAGDAVALGAIVSTFGCLNGWILLQGQMPFAAARDRLFPAGFARLNRYGAPAFGLVVSSVLMTVFMIPNYNSSLVSKFTDFILLATTTTLIAYLYGAAAQLALLVTERHRFSVRSVVQPMTVATLAVAYVLWTIWGAGYRSATWAMLLTFAGIPVYVWMKWQTTTKHIDLSDRLEPVVPAQDVAARHDVLV
jgi:APA family basic amino acid/polyamine antiporter